MSHAANRDGYRQFGWRIRRRYLSRLALALGLDWPEAARMGAVLAGFCVEQQGTQERRPEAPEFWGRYTEHFGAAPEGALRQ